MKGTRVRGRGIKILHKHRTVDIGAFGAVYCCPCKIRITAVMNQTRKQLRMPDASRSEGCVPAKARSAISKLGQYDLDLDLIPSHTYGAVAGERVSIR